MKKLLALVLAVAMMIIPMTALADSNFIEPTYYADYTEDVEYVTPEEETTDYVVICRALNVRATASTKLDPIDIIHRGDVVKVVEFDGNWAKIALEDGTNAYVYAKYIDKVEAFVKVVEFDGNWAKIALEDGTNAYVYAKYIDKVEA